MFRNVLNQSMQYTGNKKLVLDPTTGTVEEVRQ